MTPMDNVNMIAIDLEGVLLTDGLVRARGRIGTLGLTIEQYDERLAEIAPMIETGRADADDLWPHLAQRACRPAALRDLVLSEYQPIPYGVTALHVLRAQGYAVVIAANSARSLMIGWMEQFAWLREAEQLFNSAALTHRKPDVAYFEHLKTYEPLAYVDDQDAVIRAARMCGVTAIAAKGEGWLYDLYGALARAGLTIPA
jgi:FMN phosphatase YigB (HAD superfamily)